MALLVACANTMPPSMVERVGGAVRTRSFASPTAYEAFLRAELATARGDHAAALRQLDLATLADPRDGYIAARRVEILIASGDIEGARAAADDVTHDHPTLSAAWIALAEARAHAGDTPGAMEAVARAVALDPDDSDVRAAAAAVGGGDAMQVATARAGAPSARAGDRVNAARVMALDPTGMFRRTAASQRRQRALAHIERGEWAAVDTMLSSLVTLDPTRVIDRIRVIEARVFDGRPADAAPLVSGLRVGNDSGSVRAAERARLWLLVGRVEVAIEEARAALRSAPDDVLAVRVLGHGLLRAGRLAEGIEVLARVPIDASATPAVVLTRDLVAGATSDACVVGEGPDAPGVAWILARIAVAQALSAAGRDDVGGLVLSDALRRLTGPSTRGARDMLRTANAQRLSARGLRAEARAVMADVETAWGRHRRAALVAFTEAPERVLGDLRARASNAYEDAVADAWLALVCVSHAGACEAREARAALARALRDAPDAPATLRARAALSDDRREAAELVRRAASRDPGSPWTAALVRQLGLVDAH